jgi:hypothetical protein
MEDQKEQDCEPTNWAQLNKPMANGTKFVCPSSLVMLCIVRKDDKCLGTTLEMKQN